MVSQPNAGQAGTLNGSIIGIEHQIQPVQGGPIGVEVLNLWCAEGVRSVRLNEIQRLRFQNPAIENEFSPAAGATSTKCPMFSSEYLACLKDRNIR